MKMIGERTKIYSGLLSLLSLFSLIGLVWYLVSLSNGYNVLVLSMILVFGFLFLLFLLLFVLDFRKRKEGIYFDGNHISFFVKGKKMELSLLDVKEVAYRPNHNIYFRSLTGSVFLDAYEIKDVRNAKRVASSLLQIQEDLRNKEGK